VTSQSPTRCAPCRYGIARSFRISNDAHEAHYFSLEPPAAKLAGCADTDVRQFLADLRREFDVVRRFAGQAGYTFLALQRAVGDGSTGGSDAVK